MKSKVTANSVIAIIECRNSFAKLYIASRKKDYSNLLNSHIIINRHSENL